MPSRRTISVAGLDNVPETLLYPLIARCLETKKKHGLLDDPKSVEIYDSLDHDFSPTRLFVPGQLGVVFRTLLLDRQIGAFLQAHPDAVVVNLGCGLDTRFSRIDNGTVTWLDLDLPECIALRSAFFRQSDRYRFIRCSALDPAWTRAVPQGRPLLIVAEGLCMYFSEREVKQMVGMIRTSFAGADFFLEAIHPLLIKLGTKRAKDPADRKTAALLRWGIKSGSAMAAWFEGVEFVEEWHIIEAGRTAFPRSFRLLFALLPGLTRLSKIVHLRFSPHAAGATG